MRLARVISTYCIASLVLPMYSGYYYYVMFIVLPMQCKAEKDRSIVIELTLNLF